MALCSTDLTTYDTAKQAILRNTNLKDNAVNEFSIGDIVSDIIMNHH